MIFLIHFFFIKCITSDDWWTVQEITWFFKKTAIWPNFKLKHQTPRIKFFSTEFSEIEFYFFICYLFIQKFFFQIKLTDSLVNWFFFLTFFFIKKHWFLLDSICYRLSQDFELHIFFFFLKKDICVIHKNLEQRTSLD